ncbi:hypothetical protein [Priestia taiwanensis]|uniref:Uncharacterized protein n=1 Tax=Priestia taiwanensis TaxID=1347902 RepID=A0A917ASU4_9BACI|nr:hypothetical protein [Priestia taiwanensis]MBM7363938.1 hypothetical protein [Priestia taiwanensis]GGE70316.1 hypothetical protein GCM10007140_20290 [Priestia taiwanensis]
MRYFRKTWYLFIILYIVFVLFDYWRDKTFNWGENIFQLAFFMLFLWFFNWAFERKESR